MVWLCVFLLALYLWIGFLSALFMGDSDKERIFIFFLWPFWLLFYMFVIPLTFAVALVKTFIKRKEK